jgi:hypothetical protein
MSTSSLRLSLALAIAALGLHAGNANAADPILIDATVPLAEGIPQIPECPWNTELATAIAAQSGGVVATSPTPVADAKGRVMLIRATHVRVPGGGNFSGPKWIRLQGELRLDGQTLVTFDKQRTSGSGWPKSTCSTARYVAKALAADLAKWARENADTVTPVAPAAAPAPAPAEPAPADAGEH